MSNDENRVESDSSASDSNATANDSNTNNSRRFSISRRKLVVGTAGIGLGSIIGGGYAIMGNSEPGRAVKATEPDGDGEATLGELHYILENSGPEHSRLDITSFRYYSTDAEIKITYRTRAPDVEEVPPQRQHVREVGQMANMFSEYVAQNGDKADLIHARIENPSEPAKQPDGYLVQRKWVEKFNSGEWSGNRLINQVLGNAYTDEALNNESTNNSD